MKQSPITNAPMKKAPTKKAIIDFVKLTNHFFFFVGFLVIASIATFEFYEHRLRPNQSYESSLQIVDDKQAKQIPIEYKKSFVEKYGDIFIFKVRSNRLVDYVDYVDYGSTALGVVDLHHFSGGYDVNDFESVNFLFSA